MGLKFYIGASGSGKSYLLYSRIIDESIKNPHANFLIVVPEQFTMQTQLELVKRHPNKGIMNIDVLSFGRLSHRIFEEAGGNDMPVLDDTGKNLVLRKVAAEVCDELNVMRRNVKKPGYISEIKSSISEFMQYGLKPDDVAKLCEYASKRGALSYKLKDLHTLYKGFLSYTNERFITTEEELSRLCNVLGRSRLLKGSVIAFDGFTGFTPVQNKVIQELMLLAKQVIVTVTIDARENPYVLDGEQKLFHLSKKTICSLDKLCVEAGAKREKDEKIADERVFRYKNNAGLSHLEREIFRYPYREFADNQESIRIFEASNPREEIRQVCLKIRRLVREENYCYRDIAVVTGDLERYGFIAEEEFSRLGIPFFMDRTNKLILNPFIEFIRSALLVAIQGYSYESVFHFLRCGLSGVGSEEADRLENYVMTMGIRGKSAWGKRFTRHQKEWGEAEEALCELNAIRVKIVSMIEPLNVKKATGREFVTALYEFILNAEIEKGLYEYAESFKQRGELVRAKEYEQIYRLVMELLEQICALLGDEELEIKEFADILDAGFAEIKVGTIPQSVDKVVIGDIERTRMSDIKALFFVGINDGIIPKSKGTGGIISDIDREFLQQSEFELAPTPRQQMYIQRLYLYMVMTKPSDLLVLSYAKVDSEGKSIRAAYLINTVKKLFPNIYIEKPQLRNIEEQIEEPADALAYLVQFLRRYAEDGLIGAEDDGNRRMFFTLYDTCAKNEKYAHTVEGMKRAAFEYLANAADARLPRELAGLLYGQMLRNSVSRLEKFASCAYAHFLQYGIKLSERDKYNFERVDMGNVFHAVLESFSEKLNENGCTWFDFSSELGERLVRECLESYAASYGGTVLYSSKRNEYMITRMERILNRTVKTLQYQLRQGVFEPDGIEVSFQEEQDLDAVNIALSDSEEKEKMRLIGRIDRIDTCRQGDKLYVKVIDYKSGSRKFDLAALYYGLQLQLAVYMNAAVEMQKKKNPDAHVLPAAMLYYHVSDPMTETGEAAPDPSEVEEAILDELKMTGMVSDDEAVIRLLDKGFETKSTVLPVAKKKDGGYTKASSVLSEEDFETVSNYVNHKIKELGMSILDGDIALNPYEQKDAASCEYCAYKSVCGFDRRLGAGLVRHLEELDNERALERMRKSGGDRE